MILDLIRIGIFGEVAKFLDIKNLLKMESVHKNNYKVYVKKLSIYYGEIMTASNLNKYQNLIE